jgi:Chaperone of endosialidase
VGFSALSQNATGRSNTAIGNDALAFNSSGHQNTAAGDNALTFDTTGTDNTAIGASALTNNTTGNFNIALGIAAGQNVRTASNVICIGAVGADVSNSCYIGQIFGVTFSGGTAVLINSNGQLGTATSSRRFKDGIKPVDKASEALFALKPVAFRYKKDIDPAGTPQLGLVAEEVKKVNPDLVVHDKEGKPTLWSASGGSAGASSLIVNSSR